MAKYHRVELFYTLPDKEVLCATGKRQGEAGTKNSSGEHQASTSAIGMYQQKEAEFAYELLLAINRILE
jgi:hypothetical protein